MRNYVIINGVNSLTIQGLAINNLPPITKPMIRTQREEIDGRDGDIVTELGYSAYDKQIEIGLWGNYDINNIIKYFTGEGTIVFSNEEDKYYNFKILDQIDYEKLLKFKTATITLHCQPFKYPLEEEPVEAEVTTLTGTGETITLNNTEEAPMKINLKGNTSQEGTPTPETPQDIHVVSGDNSINVTGKNLFTLKNISNATTLGVERTINNSELKLNGTSSRAGQVIGRQTTGIILPGGTYSVLVQKKSGNVTPNGKYTVFYFRKPDGTEITALNINNYSGNYSFKTTFVLSEETELYVEIYCTEAGYTLDNLELQFQIESGYNLTPTYEAYIEESYPINLPIENLFELPTTQTINGITFTNNGNGTFNLSGTASAITDFAISKELSTIANGKFTMSSKSTGYSLMLAFYNGINWLSTPINKLPTELIKTGNITIPSNATKYSLLIRVSSGSTINLINETAQVEKGSKANSFIPFGTTPIELCKIGNYQDRIYKDSGKWYLYKEIGKYVITSFANKGGGTANILFYTSAVSDILKPPVGNARIDTLSNYFESKSANQIYANNITGIGVNTTGTLSCGFTLSSSLTTLELANTWVASNNIIVYYPLATPTYTEITYQPLIDQLNLLEQSQSKDNQTNISQVNNDLPFELDVSVTFVVPMEINNIGNIYAKPILTIEGTGNIGVVLNDIQILEIDLTNNEKIAIDVTKLEAYNPDDDTLLNRLVTGDYMKLLINEGENTITFTGSVSSATLTNYIRWI